MNHWIELLLVLVALPAALASAYLLLLTLLSWREAARAPAQRRLRFAVVVPAHDEATVIGAAVASLRRLDWPEDLLRIVVVADNCSDDTAALARQAGAQVLERQDASLRGKGYALAYGFERILGEGWAQALVVVDADTEVDSNLIEAFAERIEGGAMAVQAYYGVLNAMASWRTRLLTIAYGAFHRVRSRARERLGWSCGIRGNGWCVTAEALARVPYQAFSLTEDAEFGADLGLAGIRVHYVDEAEVRAEQVTGEKATRSQRQRWEHGRGALIRSRVVPLLDRLFQPGGWVCLDIAFDLLIPPLASIAVQVVALLGAALLLALWLGKAPLLLWLALACLASLMLYVLRGWQLSGVGARGLLDLAGAPAFVAWKLLLKLRRHDGSEWVRTTRERR